MLWCVGCCRPQPDGETCLDCGLTFSEGLWWRESQGEALLREAFALIAQGDLQVAHDALLHAVHQEPADERAWLVLALLKSRLFLPFDVEYCLHQATRVLPSGSALHLLLGPTEDGGRLWQQGVERIAKQLLAADFLEQASFLVDLALALSWSAPAESAESWALKAEVDLARNRIEEAIGSARQAQVLGSRHPCVRYLEGLDLERDGATEGALSAYADACGNRSMRPLALHHRARLLAGQGRFEEALVYCEESVRLAPARRAPWNLYTRIALRLGNNSEAQRGIRELEALDSSEVQGLPGCPAPALPLEARPAGLLSLKLPRLLEERGILRSEQIAARDWAFALPSARSSARWPLGTMAGQTLLAEVITRTRQAFVAVQASAPRLVEASLFSQDIINAWSWLVEGGRLREVIFAVNTLPSREASAKLEEASDKLFKGRSRPALSLVVVGERAGVFG